MRGEFAFPEAQAAGKIPVARKSPGKSQDFQISAVFLHRIENPQIFDASVKPFDAQTGLRI